MRIDLLSSIQAAAGSVLMVVLLQGPAQAVLSDSGPARDCAVSLTTTSVDYGSMTRWQLQAGETPDWLSPGRRQLRLQIVCPVAQTLGFYVQSASAPDGHIRYGHDGHIDIRVREATVDGEPADLRSEAADEGLPQERRLKANSRVRAMRGSHQVQGTQLIAVLELAPQLSSAQLQVRRQTETSAQIRFRVEK